MRGVLRQFAVSDVRSTKIMSKIKITCILSPAAMNYNLDLDDDSSTSPTTTTATTATTMGPTITTLLDPRTGEKLPSITAAGDAVGDDGVDGSARASGLLAHRRGTAGLSSTMLADGVLFSCWDGNHTIDMFLNAEVFLVDDHRTVDVYALELVHVLMAKYKVPCFMEKALVVAVLEHVRRAGAVGFGGVVLFLLLCSP